MATEVRMPEKPPSPKESGRPDPIAYPDILMNAPIGCYTSSPEGKFLSANAALARLLGYDSPEALIDSVTDIGRQVYANPNDRKQIMELLDAQGETLDYECVWLRRNGRRIWVSINAKTMRGENGRVAFLYGFANNISQRKQAEEALQEKTALLQNITDNISDLVSLTDMTGCYKFLGASHKILGYDPDALIGKNVLDFVHPDDHAEISAAFQTFVSNLKNDRKVEYRYRCADGRYLWLETVGRLICSEKGAPIEILFSTRDITERKLSEQVLMEKELVLHYIIQGLPIPAFVIDKHHRILHWNEALEMLTGIRAESVIGTDHHWRFFYNKKRPCLADLVVDQALDEISRWYADQHVHSKFIEGAFEATDFFPALGKNGKWLRFTVAAIRDAGGEVIGAIETIEDITIRKQQEADREKLQEQLNHAQKMESIGRLAGGVAHDFNNMLSVINGYAEMMADVLSPSDPMYDNVREIRDAGKRSAIIVRKLLAFARKQTISPAPVNLNDSVSGMLGMLQRLVGENLNLLWKPGNNLWLVKMDFSQIDQILANLCVNARDAIDDVGKLTIETKNVELDETYCASHGGFVPGQFVMLAVSDNGCGMEEDVLEKLFEPFFTTKGVGKGTGLGMPTVYGIVKQNNGFINVYSEPGKGTTVKIYLPRHMADTPDVDMGQKKESPMGNGETILVLEDEDKVLSITRIMLERLGYRVLPANTPAEAMALASAHDGKIDLLLTDIVMPKMNGREFADQLNALYPGIRTLFMSGYTSNVIAHHNILDDGIHFIEKPFSTKDLAAKITEMLHLKAV